jgi:hypothetical protein
MKQLATVIVCLVVLYAVDAYFFGGWYFSIAGQVVDRAYAFSWQ